MFKNDKEWELMNNQLDLFGLTALVDGFFFSSSPPRQPPRPRARLRFAPSGTAFLSLLLVSSSCCSSSPDSCGTL